MWLWLLAPCSGLLRGTRGNADDEAVGLPELEVPDGWTRHQEEAWSPPYYFHGPTRTSQWSFPETKEKPLRVVTYQWSGAVGFNNRIGALQIAYLVAHATGRTLVAQPFLTGHFNHSSNLGSWGTQVPYTAYLAPIKGALSFTEVPLGDGRTVENLDMDWYGGQGLTVADLRARYGGSTASVLNFKFASGWWVRTFDRSQHLALATRLREQIRFAPGVVAGAELLRQHLPPQYGAVHFRLGDRPGESLVDCSKVGKGTATGSWNTEDVYGVKTWPAGVDTIYVATNRPQDARVPQLAQEMARGGRAMKLWEDFPGAARAEALRLAGASAGAPEAHRAGALVSCLEQMLAVSAVDYLPAWPSSWDQFVLTMRYGGAQHDADNFNAMALALLSHEASLLGPPYVPSGYLCGSSRALAGARRDMPA